MYGARELMGRTIVPMKPFCEAPGAVLEQVHDFGLQDWSSIGGPVSPPRPDRGPNAWTSWPSLAYFPAEHVHPV